MSEILVVIPTVIEHPYKYKLLDQLAQDPHVANIVVVDNGYCFEIPEAFKQPGSKLERVRPGCNLNWLSSCNLGAVLALERKIPYVCFLNDDVELSNPFFSGMLATFARNPNAAVVVPNYNGSFGENAHCAQNKESWQPRQADIKVSYIDGTCVLLPKRTLETIGLLDPVFQHPGWGADVDYAYRVAKQNKELYVCQEAMLWHAQPEGGTSACVVYGSKEQWQLTGTRHMQVGFNTKYGKDWRKLIPLPEGHPALTWKRIEP